MKSIQKLLPRVVSAAMAAMFFTTAFTLPVSAAEMTSDASSATSAVSSETSLHEASASAVSNVKVKYGSSDVDVTNTPSKIFEIPRLSILYFTVKSTHTVSYIAGTGTVARTGTPTPYHAATGETIYSVTAVGAFGTSSGLFVDGKKVFAIKVGRTPFDCDTTMPVSKEIGSNYTFKVTAENSTDKLSFHVGNGSVASTYAKPAQMENGKKVYYFELTAAAPGKTGVYITVNNTTYYSFDFIAQAVNNAPHTYTCSPSVNITKSIGETYSFKVTANNPDDTVTCNTGNGNISSASFDGSTLSGGKRVYSFRLSARQAGATGVYVHLNQQSTRAFSITVQGKKQYAVLTGDGVYLRSGPGQNYPVLDTLAKGTSFEVLDSSNADWTKVQTSSGRIGYVSSQYLQLTTTPGGGTAATSLTFSQKSSSGTFPAGKSMYIMANVQPAGSFVVWSSSDTSVAKVKTDGNYCYIMGIAPGSATITASSGGLSASCSVTVTAAKPVRITYASPNVALAGQNVTLYATTDTSRTDVQFAINSKTYPAELVKTDTTNDVQTRLWQATVSGLASGAYRYTATSRTSGSGFSTSGITGNVYVTSAADTITTKAEDHHMSEAGLKFLAEKEGYYASPYRDELTSNQIPTTGYGMVLYEGDSFYNDMTEKEAFGCMVNDVNSSSYTSAVNTLRQNNNLWMSQSQADALISFAYNIGSAYFTDMSTSCTFREVMLNAVVPPSDASSSKPYLASLVNSTPYCSSVGGGTSLGTIPSRASVQVIGISDQPIHNAQHRNVWYQVQYGGKTGWVSSGYVRMSSSYNLKHDLNYTNATVLGSEMARWCNAGGTPIKGLMYRRMEEANIYNYADYKYDLDYIKTNPYSYILPIKIS